MNQTQNNEETDVQTETAATKTKPTYIAFGTDRATLKTDMVTAVTQKQFKAKLAEMKNFDVSHVVHGKVCKLVEKTVLSFTK